MAYLLQIVSLCWHGIMVRVVTLETKTVSLCKSWKDINRAYWLICWKNNLALVFKTISKRLAFITILVVYGLYLLIFTGPRLFFATKKYSFEKGLLPEIKLKLFVCKYRRFRVKLIKENLKLMKRPYENNCWTFLT